jgi:hypothetical protein
MKRSLVLTLVLFLVSLSLFAQQKDFRIGYSGSYPNWNLNTTGTNWSWYGDLNAKIWQGWGIGEVGITHHSQVLNNLNTYNLDGWFQPDSLQWFALGKVVIHQAEQNTTDNFKYNTHSNAGTDVTETWMGETVTARYFNVTNIPVNERGSWITVLKNVKENRIQTFSGLVLDPMKQWRWEPNGYQFDNSWYIKPRMRISTTDAFGPVKNVMKIIVRAFNGDTILEQEITTNHFRYNETQYDGRYLEDFFIDGINVPANTSSLGINKGIPPNFSWQNVYYYGDSCKVDFEIQWYRDVSVWIDYVKVMDRPAYLLVHPDPVIRERARTVFKNLNFENNE